MTAMTAAGRPRNLILAGMIFAVAMTFIDQTIVSIAAPNIQRELHLTDTGMQWAINAYLIALAALFAFGGRLADTIGHRRMVVLGVIVFAGASTLCGLTPKGSGAEAWLISFRALQGAGGAIMFPAALGIVVQTFPLRQRGKALAMFFGITGALTAVGPILGGYLTEWTWRAIFWVNIPVAIVALILIAISKPVTEYKPAPVDVRGVALIVAGVTVSVIGFQQASTWGWGNAGTIVCIVAGIALLVTFALVERKTESPLMKVDIFRNRAFAVENGVLGIAMLAFVPLFFFASEYAQVALNESAKTTGLVLLYFFLGFVVASQIGGRILDARGAKWPVVIGCAVAAVGFALWAGKMTDLSLSHQVWAIVLAGAGMGFMLSPASTDAVNRASRLSYGEATGITQTVRNFAASLGLAILGTILVSRMHAEVTSTLLGRGASAAQAAAGAAEATSGTASGSGSGTTANIPHYIRLDFAHSSQTVFYVMAGIMALAAIVALVGLQSGVQPDLATVAEEPTPDGDPTPDVSVA
jgi:EmrB/QacA subfamily drug resistance transporter